MIPQLHISKVQSTLYEARILDGSEQIFESTIHGSITDAIKDVADDSPNELADSLIFATWMFPWARSRSQG